MESFPFPVDVLNRIREYIPDDYFHPPIGSDKDFVRFVLSHRGVWNEASQMVAEMRQMYHNLLHHAEVMARDDEVECADQAVFRQEVLDRATMIRTYPDWFRMWWLENYINIISPKLTEQVHDDEDRDEMRMRNHFSTSRVPPMARSRWCEVCGAYSSPY